MLTNPKLYLQFLENETYGKVRWQLNTLKPMQDIKVVRNLMELLYNEKLNNSGLLWKQ